MFYTSTDTHLGLQEQNKYGYRNYTETFCNPPNYSPAPHSLTKTNHKSISISIRNVRSAADGSVHARLCERRLIQLIVTPLAITHVVDDDVLTKCVPVSHCQLARFHHFLHADNSFCYISVHTHSQWRSFSSLIKPLPNPGPQPQVFNVSSK